jgi:hypothetical protein
MDAVAQGITETTPPEFLTKSLDGSLSAAASPSTTAAESSKALVFTVGSILSLLLFDALPIDGYPWCLLSPESESTPFPGIVWPEWIRASAHLAEYPESFLNTLSAMLSFNTAERPWLSQCVTMFSTMPTVDDVLEMRLRASVDAMDATIKVNAAAITKLTAELKQAESERDAAAQRLDQLTSQEAAERAELSSLHASFDEEVSHHNAEVAEWQAKATEAEAKVSVLQAELVSLQANLSGELAAARQQLEAQQSERAAAEAALRADLEKALGLVAQEQQASAAKAALQQAAFDEAQAKVARQLQEEKAASVRSQ